MNRREFIQTLGLTVATMAIDPSGAIAKIIEESGQYPPLRFTGFKESCRYPDLAGQVLWAILFELPDRTLEVTHYYVNAMIYGVDFEHPRPEAQARAYLESKSFNMLAKATKMIDQEIVLAERERCGSMFAEVPNPDYDPSHVCNIGEDDDESACALYCPGMKTIRQLIEAPILRMNPVSWKDLERACLDQDRMSRLLDRRYAAGDFHCSQQIIVEAGMARLKELRWVN